MTSSGSLRARMVQKESTDPQVKELAKALREVSDRVAKLEAKVKKLESEK